MTTGCLKAVNSVSRKILHEKTPAFETLEAFTSYQCDKFIDAWRFSAKYADQETSRRGSQIRMLQMGRLEVCEMRLVNATGQRKPEEMNSIPLLIS
jgi:hypothetical protein